MHRRFSWLQELTLTKFCSFLFCCCSSLKTLTASVWWLQNSPYTCFIFSAFSSENWERGRKTLTTEHVSVYSCAWMHIHQPAEAVHLQSDGWGNFGGSQVGLQLVGVPAALQRGFCERAAGGPSRGRSGPHCPSWAAAPQACLSWRPPTWPSGFVCGAALSASTLYGGIESGL